MTAQKLTKITAGKESIRYRINALYCPINTPVQQAHTGNWCPLIKKLRSGRWWHPANFPKLMQE